MGVSTSANPRGHQRAKQLTWQPEAGPLCTWRPVCISCLFSSLARLVGPPGACGCLLATWLVIRSGTQTPGLTKYGTGLTRTLWSSKTITHRRQDLAGREDLRVAAASAGDGSSEPASSCSQAAKTQHAPESTSQPRSPVLVPSSAGGSTVPSVK